MSDQRLDQLRAMLAEEPGDTFLRYAIALELKRRGDMEQAVANLEALLRDDPAHVPSYHQLALMLADMGRIAKALEACQAGALRCVITGDRKARRELLELAAQLGEVDEA